MISVPEAADGNLNGEGAAVIVLVAAYQQRLTMISAFDCSDDAGLVVRGVVDILAAGRSKG